jgi:hypothetical protein
MDRRYEGEYGQVQALNLHRALGGHGYCHATLKSEEAKPSVANGVSRSRNASGIL